MCSNGQKNPESSTYENMPLHLFDIKMPHLKSLIKNMFLEPKASDLQAFRVFSQHPKWVIMQVNPWKVWSIAFIK